MKAENQYQEISYELSTNQVREYLKYFSTLKKIKKADFPCCGVRENISKQTGIETCQNCGQSFYVIQ